MENALIHMFSVKEKGKRHAKFYVIPCTPGEENLDSAGVRALTERVQQRFPADTTLNYLALGEDPPVIIHSFD